MIADLHGVTPGAYHVVVDEEALHLILAVGSNPFSCPIVMGACPCGDGGPPAAPVSLLGFLAVD